MLDFDQNAAEEAYMLTIVAFTDHAADDVVRGVVLRNRSQRFQNSFTRRVFRPHQIEREYLWQRLDFISVVAFVMGFILG